MPTWSNSLSKKSKSLVGRGFSRDISHVLSSWAKESVCQLQFLSGHGFSRAANAWKSVRLQPLRCVVVSCHTGPLAPEAPGIDFSTTAKLRRKACHNLGLNNE